MEKNLNFLIQSGTSDYLMQILREINEQLIQHGFKSHATQIFDDIFIHVNPEDDLEQLMKVISHEKIRIKNEKLVDKSWVG